MEELDMEKKEQLYEGKAKKVFATDDANLVIVDYRTMQPHSTVRRRAPSPARA